MDTVLYQQISDWFDAHQEEMTQDIMRLARIPSVSDPAAPAKPFGQPCRDCMDEMLLIGREHGFETENYEYYVGSIGSGPKDWENMIGFWNHLDVVPAGNDWENPPFEPVRQGPFLLGRGVQDNKGPAIGILYMMQCIRELHLPLTHELRLFVGCDEERGMEDLAYYTVHYPTPTLSMIADAGFPVCYGEKGILEGALVSGQALSAQFLEFSGGNASNMIPDGAQALLAFSPELKEALYTRLGQAVQDQTQVPTQKRPAVQDQAPDQAQTQDQEAGHTQGRAAGHTQGRAAGHTQDQTTDQYPAQYIEISQEEGGLKVIARGIGKHSAFPYGSRNAIHVLCSFLMDVEALPSADREILKNLAWFSEEFDGEHFEIRYEDQLSGKTTCAATILTMQDHRPALNLNIRYSITADSQYMDSQLAKAACSNGMTWRLERDSAPNYFPKEHPAVELLTNLYCEITGMKRESYVMGGGTYARKLPNAFAYGVGGMQESPEDRALRAALVRPGHGGAHEPDEILNLNLLTEAMKIYTMSVIALNDCPLRMPA